MLTAHLHWELEQKKIDEAEVPKVDKNNWVKTMENTVLHLKLMLNYAVQCHIKVAHILPGYGAYLNLDKEMITRAPNVDSRSNLKLNQDSLDRVYLNHQCDAFKINNALVYQILSKVSTDTDAYVNM